MQQSINGENCAICGKNMNWIQAGTSKTTGKFYNGFYSCPNRCKQPTYTQALQQNRNAFNQSYHSYNAPNTTQDFKTVPSRQISPNNGTVDWDKVSTGKVRHGVAIEAIKKDMILNEETKKWIDNWTTFIMTGNLTQPELKDTRQLLDEQGYEEAPDVPFEEMPPVDKIFF